MQLNKWKIRGEIYSFPSNWNKDQVLTYANTDIKVCPICSKIDAGLDHFNNCDPKMEVLRQQRMQDYYD